MSSIVDAVLNTALRIPEKTACVFPSGEKISYGVLSREIFCTAKFLAREILAGTENVPARVLISAEKTHAFLVAYFGVHLAGKIAVPVDPETNADRLAKIADAVKPSAFLGNFLCGNVLAEKRLRHLVLPHFSALCGNEDFSAPQNLEEKIADIVFTTGTTGAPKGVCLSHKAQFTVAGAINQFVGTREDDVEVVALPICHSFGLGRVRCLLSVGATVVFVNGFAAVKRLFRALEENRATGFAMVPASWAYLKKMSGEKIARFAGTLRYVEIGSAAMPLAEKRLLMRLLPQTRLCMHYGLTEASRSAFIEFHSDERNLDSIGSASACSGIAIFDATGHRVPAGEEGEICVRGEHILAGYWDAATQSCVRAESAFFEKSFFRTGDLGLRDEKGFFHLSGRLKELINVGGKKVSPQEVEEKLNAFPEILESACIGVPDPEGVLGEVVKACVVLRERGGVLPAPAELRARLMPLLESYKIPAFFECIPEIPKTASGKLQRQKLKILLK